ncbi:MAG: HAD-IIIA family hydrolase [Bacteroidetes bacterium]|nr:HAD-IIIA family hydrolase [Bacteroidota bacterium]
MIPLVDKSWTLFLDRDGVVNERIMGGYVLSPDLFHFTSGAELAISKFNSVFGRTLVVTNQQCIAKNILSESNLSKIHDYMSMKLKLHAAFVDKVYFAPELASNPNNTRKPKPSMAYQAKQDFPEIDFRKSIMVGDTDSDIKFGKNLEMFTVRIKTEEPIGVEADLTVQSLYEFSQKFK